LICDLFVPVENIVGRPRLQVRFAWMYPAAKGADLNQTGKSHVVTVWKSLLSVLYRTISSH